MLSKLIRGRRASITVQLLIAVAIAMSWAVLRHRIELRAVRMLKDGGVECDIHTPFVRFGSHPIRGFIRFRNDQCSVANLKAASDIRALLDVSIVGAVLDKDTVGALAGIKQINSLAIVNSGMTDELVAMLRPLRLRTLDLSHNPLAGTSLSEIDPCWLEYLSMDHTEIGDTAIQFIPRFRKLRGLSLSSTHVTGQSLVYVARAPEIESVHLSDITLSASNLKHLVACPNLSVLTCDRCTIDEKGIDTILRISALQHVGMQDAKIAVEYLQALLARGELSRLSFDLGNGEVYGRKP